MNKHNLCDIVFYKMFSRKQKFIFGLVFVFIAVFSVLLFNSDKAQAVTEAEVNRATYRALSSSQIEMTITRPPNDGNDYFRFTEGNGTTDLEYEYGKNAPYAPGDICAASITLSGPIPQSASTVTARAVFKIANSGDDNLLECVDNNNDTTWTKSIQVTIPAEVAGGGSVDPNDPNAEGANQTAEINECKRGSITSFEFWACPLLEALDSMATSMNGIIEDLLFFDTTGSEDATGIKNAWNLFRYVASVLIVIAMLVMVISQAVSWGPFDAYTVRKILPKLIMAAIAIQLSWWLCIFVIDLFNDIGRGVANLMLLPFGGASELTLDNIIAESFEGVGSGTRLGIFAIMIAGGILAFFNIFLLLAMAIGVVASLFIGFVVLVVRKLLLILLIIMAPIALALWILPGTKRYWDLWQNTFIGLLMMFPIIMALIASGRIMAWVVAEGNSFGSVSLGSFLDFLIILVAFFAPFWLIPKTFQWGGKAFGNLAGVINNGSKGVFDRPKGFMQNRQKGINEERKRASAQRVAGGKSSFIRGDHFRSGALDPTLGLPGSKRRRRQQAAYVGAGYAVEEQEVKDQTTLMTSGGLDTTRLVDRAVNGTSAERQAAISILAKRRQTNALTDVRNKLDTSEDGRTDWQKALNSNFGDIKESGVHLVGGRGENESWDDADLKSFQKAGDEARSKMNADSWRRFEQVAGTAVVSKAVADIRNNENLSGNLVRVTTSHEEIPGSPVDEITGKKPTYSTTHPLYIAPGSVGGSSGSSGGGDTDLTDQEIILRARGSSDTVDKAPGEWTARDYANAENTARDEYDYLKALGVRTPEQEKRLQQYRDNFPDWK